MTDARTDPDLTAAASPPTPAAAAPPEAGGAPDPLLPGSDDRGDPGVGASRRRGGRLARAGTRLVEMPAEGWITFTVVAVCVVFVVAQMDPGNLVSDTTPAGGDMGAHVWGPAYLRDHLLTKGRLTGWTPDWYAGFPAYHYYMILPSLAIALLSFVIPYGVAFKLVAVSGIVTLPISCWFFGRSARLPFPGPPLLALGGLLFLFDRAFSIYGGNIASTLAGEFAFSISLSLALVYLGLLARGLETGRCRGWAALLLALTGLCHLIPFIFVAVCTVLWMVVRPGWGTLKWVFTMTPVAVLLMAFWVLPFGGRRGYVNDMGWEKITSDRYLNYLWDRTKLDAQLVNSPDLRVVIAVAAVGLLLSIVYRRRLGVFLALGVVTFAAGFMYAPQGPLWNARILPFYYLCLYLLAAVGIAETGRLLASLFAPDLNRPLRAVTWLTPIAAGLGVLVLLGMSLRILPFGRINDAGAYEWGAGPFTISTTDRSFIDSWADWNFTGYEGFTEAAGRVQYKKSYPEYRAIIDTMASVGAEHGCGRAMTEHEEAHDRYGTPMALMLLPFWTDGCIGSMEGLYFEASATTPYHFLNQDELSWSPSNAQREMPYVPGPPTVAEFDKGITHLQMSGVKYYLAINDNTKKLADAHKSLRPLTTSGPWSVYEVQYGAGEAPMVQALRNRPAVLDGQPVTGRPWQDVAVCWWLNQPAWDVVLTADGPADWQRVSRTVHPAEGATPAEECRPSADWAWFDAGRQGPVRESLPEVKITNYVQTDDRISFDVDRPGVPVLVKTSYFPNWQATGAAGPYRAMPNFMVVVPEGTHVDLHYGYTGLDLVSYALTALGIVALVLLFRARPVRMAPVGAFWGRAERPDLYPGNGFDLRFAELRDAAPGSVWTGYPPGYAPDPHGVGEWPAPADLTAQSLLPPDRVVLVPPGGPFPTSAPDNPATAPDEPTAPDDPTALDEPTADTPAHPPVEAPWDPDGAARARDSGGGSGAAPE